MWLVVKQVVLEIIIVLLSNRVVTVVTTVFSLFANRLLHYNIMIVI